MSGSIDISNLIGVNPSVLPTGGEATEMVGVILTQNPRVPYGTAPEFPNADAVGSYFGVASAEAEAAVTYFNAHTIKQAVAGSLMFFQYPPAAVAAYLRGGSMVGVPLATLQAYSGSISVPVDGVAKSAAATVSLAAATSWTSAATIIGTALGASCTYDSIANAFVITSGTEGAASSLGYASGTLAMLLNLTSATGAIISNGAIAGTPATIMADLIAETTDWATFSTLWEPVIADKTAFAAWNTSQNKRFMYVPWDTDQQAIVPDTVEAFGAVLATDEYEGVALVYNDPQDAFFLMGFVASLDFDATNGRMTAAFKSGAGLTPTVTNGTTAATLIANGYNYYGRYSTRRNKYNFLYPGSVCGSYDFIDSYVNQIWLNSYLQDSLTVLETAVGSIPYNPAGYAMMETACLDPINAALNFGAIRSGVTLSAAEAQEVNNAAGATIDGILSTRGWYLQIKDAAPATRQLRGSPPCTFWYMDGGSVQSIQLNSVEVQ